jgi:hypothetical protein
LNRRALAYLQRRSKTVFKSKEVVNVCAPLRALLAKIR